MRMWWELGGGGNWGGGKWRQSAAANLVGHWMGLDPITLSISTNNKKKNNKQSKKRDSGGNVCVNTDGPR
jgi:hypothetical protein